MASKAFLQQAYLAYFGRPADPSGLAFYAEATEAQVKAAFSASPESQAFFGSLSVAQQINTIYNNLFNRDAEPAGLAYWSQEIGAGRLSLADAAMGILTGAQNDDKVAVTNKLAASDAFTAQLDTTAEILGYAGAASVTLARAFLAAVDSTPASLTAATAGVAASVAGVTAVGVTNAGQTFTLTTGVDNFTGTSGNDTFSADNTGATAVLSSADVLNGGTGDDTLNVYSAGTAFNLPALTSIETLNVYDQTADQSIAAANFASVTTANLIRGDGAMTLTGGANLATVGVSDVAATGAGADVGIVLAFEAARTSATVNLNGVTAAGNDTDENIDINGAALTTVTVNTTGTASSFDVLDVASATAITIDAGAKLTVTSLETGATAAALTITGAGAVNLGALDTAIDTVTATAATGGLTAAIGAEVDTVVTLGSGNDVITAGTTDALVTANTLSVDAGAGTADVLVITETADVDTAADAARYKNFEIIRTADSVNMGLVAGVTALQITGGTSETYSNLTAAQAGNITFQAANTTSTIFTLADASGTADAITINLASTTATTDVDVVGISVANIETVTFNATTGTNTTGDTAIGFLANSADSVSKINVTGTSDVTLTVAANTLDVVAVNIDASTMTGTADFTLVQTSDLVAGSTVTGTLNADTIALGTTRGSTYNGGAGDDAFSGALAVLVATGTNDTKVNAGTGTDTLTLTDTTTTLDDNHFTFVTGMEKLALSNTVGDLSITTGSAFNAAFATGATITTGVMAATKDVTLNAGLSNVAINLTIDATSLVGTAAEAHVISTGSGADTVTFTGDATYVGVNGAAQGTIAISTGAGNDTISVTVGTLLASTAGQFATITAGTGADTITKVGVNSTTATSVAHFAMAAGDSTTTAWDSITGFDVSDGTALSDGLDFAGTAAVGTLATHLDFGTILSHNITAGVATFDDAASYNAAVVINATNLADVVGYLALNTATNDVVAFAYDSDASGTADATMVFHNGTTDSLVLLVGVTGVDAVVDTNAAGANDLFIA